VGYSGGRLAPWFDSESTKETIVEMVEAGVHHLHGRIVELTPVDSGNLKQSWQITPLAMLVSPRGMIYERTVETHVDYAPYVEHGTGLWGPKHAKYVIEPKTPGGTLHWLSPEGLNVFAKRVLHPGSPGAHMVAIAVSELEATLEERMQPLLQAWARKVERQNHTGLGRPNPPMLGRVA
jgi:hypothetical protein